MDDELLTLLVIAAIAASAPLLADLPRRVRLPVVVLEIVGGILVGPHVLEIAEAGPIVTFLSQVGLAFLFFLAGMEIDFVRMPPRAARLAAYGWVLSLALGFAIAGVLEVTGFVLSILLIGVALATTAVGTLIPILRDAEAIDTRVGTHMVATGVAGEFGPILAISLLLTGAQGPGLNAALLLAFAAVAVGLGALVLRARPPRVLRVLERTMHSSGQLAIRMAILILMALVYLTGEFGLDVVLGAFAAGIVVGLVVKTEEAEPVRSKLEAIGFGFVVPIFFITSGLTFDLPALFESASSVLRLPVFLALFFVVRGLPVLLLYRHDLPRPERLPLMLTSATALPLVVAIATIGLDEGHMRPDTAAALVGAGMVSVLVFPLVALALLSRSPGSLEPLAKPVLTVPNVGEEG